MQKIIPTDMDGINPSNLSLFAHGSHQAFGELFDRLYPRLYYFVQGFIKDQYDTDDVVQAIFIGLWEHHEKFAHVDHFDAYVYRIAKNAIFTYMRRKRVFADLDTLVSPPAVTQEADERIDAEDLRLLIDMVVEQMPPQRRQVYKLSRCEELSNEEIANRLGISKKTVENHLNLALGELRKRIKELIILYILLRLWG